MPAESVIVTFTDQDGDEFPVRIGVSRDKHPDEKIISHAETLLRQFEYEGGMSPRHPVTVARIESLNRGR